MADRPDGPEGWDSGGLGAAWSVLGTLIAGLVAWGAIGFGLDRAFGFTAVFLPIGLILGAVGASWLVIVRYGRDRK
jgi:F0F1-type ATP synthase assembly protein I